MTKSPHLDEKWLRQKYEIELLSTYEIAKIVGRDPKSIYNKLKSFNIPTRPRGHNLQGKDNSWAQEGFENHWLGRNHSQEAREKISVAARKPRPHLRGESNGMFGRVGYLNPRYVDGSSPERQREYASARWKELARQCLSRDNYECRKCLNQKDHSNPFHIHHIYHWAGNPKLRFDLKNLVTLCHSCHRWVHSKKNTHREFLPPETPSRANSDNT